MRQGHDSSSGVMEFLFCQLMRWGKTQGYQQFSLGMSPLKDIAADPISRARFWPKLAKQIDRHGEKYYNFQGLRRFKDKFQPEWQARYLLVPKRINALPAMMASTLEISGF